MSLQTRYSMVALSTVDVRPIEGCDLGANALQHASDRKLKLARIARTRVVRGDVDGSWAQVRQFCPPARHQGPYAGHARTTERIEDYTLWRAIPLYVVGNYDRRNLGVVSVRAIDRVRPRGSGRSALIG